MSINVIKRYALVDISPDEDRLVKVSEGEPAPATPTAAPAGK